MSESESIFINNMSLEYIINELKFNANGYYENNTNDVVYRLQDVLKPFGIQGLQIWTNSKEMPQYILVKCLEALMNP